MNVIAVDDENLALKSIERAIRNAFPNILLTCFGTPSAAMQFAQENQVDVAFLDVEMGGINGLELAKRLKDIYGKTNIVFVTGYVQYAADSYSVQASDYIMKPVSEKDVQNAMENLRNPLAVPVKEPLI